jgi:DNA (cytosine-5)-methyltransferase 1
MSHIFYYLCLTSIFQHLKLMISRDYIEDLVAQNAVPMTALSLFSGIGGMCLGVKKAGFRIVAAVEHDKYASENYRLNFPDVPFFEGDIARFLDKQKHLTEAEMVSGKLNKGQLDLLFGGPPCQGYSQIGPRDIADPRNEMYLEVCRLADLLQPKFILIENVPNMLLMKKGMFKERIVKALKKIGYSKICINVLNAVDFGVPQARKRVFIIATKPETLSFDLQDIFENVSQLLTGRQVCVNDAISDLPKRIAKESGESLSYPATNDLSNFQRELRLDTEGKIFSLEEKLVSFRKHQDEILLLNHHTKEIQAKRLELIKLLKPGKKADSLPKEVWNNARPEKWRRFDGYQPAHTLLAQMHRDLSEWVHPKFHRFITVREALRLQSFPDSFVLKTSEWQQLKQVGNAVPPFLGRIPALVVRIALEMSANPKLKFRRHQLNILDALA